jgi:hydroxymethylpyrimidine/phosphomethylpyrimidine kinase
MTAIALTIAGSDPSGGAGVQADLKTFAALGVYGASVITALTAQNTREVASVYAVPAEVVAAQLQAVAADLEVKAVKIGMLANAAIVEAVAEALSSRDGLKRVPVVLDTVMAAAVGHPLLEDEAIKALREKLFPLATVITPNLHEAARLLGQAVAVDEAEMIAQGRRLKRGGAAAVLMKGGHRPGALATDFLIDKDVTRVESLRVYTKNTHGTGCTLSAAIAAEMAKGAGLGKAVKAAKAYVTGAIAAADSLSVGTGRGPLHHFHRQWPEKG